MKLTRTQVVFGWCGAAVLAALATQTIGRLGQDELQETPFQSETGRFVLHPPRAWTVRTLEREGAIKQTGLVTVFSEPRRTHGSSAFQATVTIAVRELPVGMKDVPRVQAKPYLQEMLQSMGPALIPTGAVRSITVNGLTGAQASYVYSQRAQSGDLDLSVRAVVLFSRTLPRCFLLTATVPSRQAHHYQRVFDSVLHTFHEEGGSPST